MGGYGGMPGGGAPMVQAGGRGPIGQTRNIGMLLVLSVVTCGIYAIYAGWTMLNELKAFRGKDDFNPALTLVLMLFLGGIPFLIFGIPDKVTEAKHMAGVPNAKAAHPVLYFLGGLLFLAIDLNETWAAAGGSGQPR